MTIRLGKGDERLASQKAFALDLGIECFSKALLARGESGPQQG
jgi:hypothetical protein